MSVKERGLRRFPPVAILSMLRAAFDELARFTATARAQSRTDRYYTAIWRLMLLRELLRMLHEKVKLLPALEPPKRQRSVTSACDGPHRAGALIVRSPRTASAIFSACCTRASASVPKLTEARTRQRQASLLCRVTRNVQPPLRSESSRRCPPGYLLRDRDRIFLRE